MPSAREVPCTSIVDSAQKPALPQRIVINSIERAPRTILFSADTNGSASTFKLLGIWRVVILRRWGAAVLRPYGDEFNFEIPFILMPSIFLPPISGAAPRARGCHYLTAHSSQIHFRRLLVVHLYTHSLWRPHHTKRWYRLGRCRIFLNSRLALSAPLVFLARHNKPAHPKTLRPMTNYQIRATPTPFPHPLRHTP